jgi:hypothetical protein
MKSLVNNITIACVTTIVLLFVPTASADAPSIKVEVYQEVDGALIPLNNAYVRWINEGGGSYKDYKANDKNTWPRRYRVTGQNGGTYYESFQKADIGKEHATLIKDVTDPSKNFVDPDFQGDVRQSAPGNAKFGCGQNNHKIAASAPGYTCDEYATLGTDMKFTKLQCSNGWCQGPFTMEECSNGYPEMTIKFKCKRNKKQDVQNVKDQPSSEQVGLGREPTADEAKSGVKPPQWAFACAPTKICNEKGLTTPTEGPKKFASCTNYPVVGSGTKRVQLYNVKRLYDRGYAQQQSQQIEAYIVECFVTGGVYSCTTGKPSFDNKIFGKNNVPSGYEMSIYKEKNKTEVITNPVDYKELGDIVEVESSRINSQGQETDSVFMMVFNRSQMNNLNIGSNTSQQFATLSNDVGCVVVHDPYGRVFDSYTLEPLEGTEVTLTKKLASGQYKTVTQQDISDTPAVGTILNPQVTEKDGIFSFFVPDGTYRLAAKKDGYTFPSDMNALNPAFVFMYDNIYRGEDIVQQGKVEHRDIPMDPVDLEASKAYAEQNQITIISYFQSVDKQRNVYKIEGRVSHPKAAIIVYAYVPNRYQKGELIKTRTLAKTEADLYGYFKLEIPLSKLKKNETIGELEAVKKKIAYPQKKVMNSVAEMMKLIIIGFGDSIAVQAESGDVSRTSVKLNPILTSVEGYAVTDAGAIMPGATVRLFVTEDNIPVYETQADETGYFAIPEASIPNMPYSLEFFGLNDEQVVTSTSQFIVRNTGISGSQYLATSRSRNANVLGASDDNNSMLTTAVIAVLGILTVLVLASIFFSQSAVKSVRSRT